ncbi:GntR family transcriptional regulator [Rossellomorea vietnamensis]|uniref:GntR family transcriptional regulator n=1 Tax=Rossellomorea vietnamensis TaxID=218284 RepID=A0A5D4MCY4_9BACI|nr:MULTISPECIES: GntR family transcriptional regulator [Bacillaceae]TYR99348.1 GntR family transcriptional regulator [Rossellomorea vietnamensis]
MIDSDNPIPYHLQIKEIIAKEIVTGTYKDRIPSERDLMERFSVSRTTIREAITHLVNDGMLKKVHGKGTFISQKTPVHEWLNSLNSLTETIIKMGMKPGSKLLHMGVMNKNDVISDMLNVDLVFHIQRLRTADSVPIAIEDHFYPMNIGVELTKYDLETTPIYDLLENELEIEMEEAEQFISSKTAHKEEALNLDVPDGSNVLCVERLITNSAGAAIEYYSSIFRPDMYVFRVKTKRKRANTTYFL